VKDVKAQQAANKLAVKEAKKQQPWLLKKTEKQSFIVVLLYKKPANLSTKAVAFTKEIKVVLEEGGSETT
jgi:hypothetical protein